MNTLYFGIDIKNECKFDVQNVAARLFLCPRIIPECVLEILNLLISGKMSVDIFNEKTNECINELFQKYGIGKKKQLIMNNKLKAWKNIFQPPTSSDYKYLEHQFGVSIQDLFGTTSCLDVPIIRSAKDMAAYVKRYVKGQDEVIDELSVSFYQHFDSCRKRYTCRIKAPVLLMGPTGVGKSELLRIFGKICDCPVIRINSSEIVPSAWKGLHISEIIARAINDGISIKDMEYAIIVFHEFDKITHYGNKIVGDRGSDMDADMMRDVMRLFETDHSLHIDNADEHSSLFSGTYNLPVDNLLIVFDGAFSGIENIISRRLNIGTKVGFVSTKYDEYKNINLQKLVTKEDLREWGYLPELLGRIYNIIVLNPLSAETIYEIMTEAKENILQSHIDYCAYNNIELRFSDEALRYIAELASDSGLGFRKVKEILSRSLNRLYYDFSGENLSQKKKVIEINKDYVSKYMHINKR